VRSRALAIACVFALLVASLPPVAIAQEGLRVEAAIGDNSFDPAELTIASGTTVAWTNTGSELHTVTSYDGAFDSGLMLPGDSFEWTFAEPGEYWYLCLIHEGQEGVVYVAAPESPAPVAEPEAPAPTAEPASAAPSAPTPVPATLTPLPVATATLVPTPTIPPTAGPSAPMSGSVTIQNFSFQPASVTIAVGGTVTWTNQDSTAHTATGQGFNTGPLSRGQSGSATFPRAGTFPYQCSIHPNMTGQVIVVG
jgi:plastocyanin